MGDFGPVRAYVSRAAEEAGLGGKAEGEGSEGEDGVSWPNALAQLDAARSELLERGSGSARAIALHHKRGMLVARERIELLLDPDSPFLELCPFAGCGEVAAEEGATPGASLVGGIGLVCGLACMITANVATVKGGTVNAFTLLKAGRLAEIARENRLPSITLTQSGGADLTQQFKVFHQGGGGFRETTRRSADKLPSICVVFGSSTAGGAYTPGMADYVVMVQKQAMVYLAGPPLVKMATGEEVGHEELGGAEMHSRVSGVSDFLARDEAHALYLARTIVQSLNQKRVPRAAGLGGVKGGAPFPGDDPSLVVQEPLYSPETMLDVVPPSIRTPYDVREVIARVVDGSRFAEFKEDYGGTLVTAFARIHGCPVGILANNGVLFSEAANKGSQFIQLCNQSDTPLLFLQNITGFMVGKQYEQEGIIKNGAKLINAVSNSAVPAITVIVGASYGAGNYGMAGRAYHPRFLFSWPTSRCSVMGPEQLGGVLDIVARQAAASRGIEFTPEMEEMADQRKRALSDQVARESDVFYTSARCLDDAIIDPRETRTVVGMALAITHNTRVQGSMEWGVFRM
jgi:acyl-CoA carboxylase subunit beta